MILVTAICPRCGNDPQSEICEDCGYDGEEKGWAIETLYLPPLDTDGEALKGGE